MSHILIVRTHWKVWRLDLSRRRGTYSREIVALVPSSASKQILEDAVTEKHVMGATKEDVEDQELAAAQEHVVELKH
jgi:hypothetical protein